MGRIRTITTITYIDWLRHRCHWLEEELNLMVWKMRIADVNKEFSYDVLIDMTARHWSYTKNPIIVPDNVFVFNVQYDCRRIFVNHVEMRHTPRMNLHILFCNRCNSYITNLDNHLHLKHNSKEGLTFAKHY